MKSVKYIIYRVGKHYVSQSLNVDVSSFGETIEEAKNNLKEALDLYFEDEPARKSFVQIHETLIGELRIQM